MPNTVASDAPELRRPDFDKIRQDAADALKTELDWCALSLEFYTQARAVDKAMGVARNAFDELRRVALGLGCKPGRLPAEEETKAAAEAADIDLAGGGCVCQECAALASGLEGRQRFGPAAACGHCSPAQAGRRPG
ncbi:hypothetical protein [Streptomyces sp. NPDC020489]|uniref:hypothetical protein n=1 Tax=Streptomyces sp. NPDC020489 TaxID=3365077 RepID=UPI0037A1D9AC